MSQVKKWSKHDTVMLILGYTVMICFISWIVEGIIKSVGYIGLVVPIGILIPIAILIIFIFKEPSQKQSESPKSNQEEVFDYTKMGANEIQNYAEVDH